MSELEFDLLNNFKGAILSEISIATSGVKFHLLGKKNYQIIVSDLSKIIIEPRSFDCPKAMSLHTQMLWLIDEVFAFLNNEIIDLKFVAGEIFAFQFPNGALAFKLEIGKKLEIIDNIIYFN